MKQAAFDLGFTISWRLALSAGILIVLATDSRVATPALGQDQEPPPQTAAPANDSAPSFEPAHSSPLAPRQKLTPDPTAGDQTSSPTSDPQSRATADGSDGNSEAPPAVLPPLAKAEHVPQDLLQKLEGIGTQVNALRRMLLGLGDRVSLLTLKHHRVHNELATVTSRQVELKGLVLGRMLRLQGLTNDAHRLEALEADLRRLVSEARSGQLLRKQRMTEDLLRLRQGLERLEASVDTEATSRDLVGARRELSRVEAALASVLETERSVIQVEAEITRDSASMDVDSSKRRTLQDQVRTLEKQLLRPELAEDERNRVQAELARLNQFEEDLALIERQRAGLLDEQRADLERRKRRVTAEKQRLLSERNRLEGKIQRLGSLPAQLKEDREHLSAQIGRLQSLIQTSEQIAGERERVFGDRLNSTIQERASTSAEIQQCERDGAAARDEQASLATRRAELETALLALSKESRDLQSFLSQAVDEAAGTGSDQNR